MSDFVWMACWVVGGLLALFGLALFGDRWIKRRFKKPEHPESPSQAAEATLADLKLWNWGAFFLTWVVGVFLYKHIIAGISNSSGNAAAFFPYINAALLMLISAISILLGLKGNASFWKSKKWKSVEGFHKSQRKRAVIGGIIFLFYVGGFFLGTGLSFLFTRRPVYQDTASLIRQNVEIQKSLGAPIRTYIPVNFRNEKGFTAFDYRASGPRGSGTVIVRTTRLNNLMQYREVEFESDGVQKKKISVYP